MTYAREIRSGATIPVFKSWQLLRDYLALGNTDFVIDTKLWSGPMPIQPPHMVPILSWGDAARYGDVGYYVFANSIDELGPYVSYIAEANKAVPLVYVRVWLPEPAKKICYADEFVRSLMAGEAD
jgi:hypothetical protein